MAQAGEARLRVLGARAKITLLAEVAAQLGKIAAPNKATLYRAVEKKPGRTRKNLEHMEANDAFTPTAETVILALVGADPTLPGWRLNEAGAPLEDDAYPLFRASLRKVAPSAAGLISEDPRPEETGDLRPGLAGLGLREMPQSTREARYIDIELRFMHADETVMRDGDPQSADRVRLKVKRAAVCFDFPDVEPPMMAAKGTRYTADGERFIVEALGDPDKPSWTFEANGDGAMLGVFEPPEALFVLEDGPDGAEIVARVMLCSKDCALVADTKRATVDPEVLSTAQRQMLKHLRVAEGLGGGYFDRVVNRKKYRLRVFGEESET